MQGNAPDEEHIGLHDECGFWIRRLRDALAPFVKEADNFDEDVSDDLHLTVRDEDGETVNTMISVGDLRRAKAALS